MAISIKRRIFLKGSLAASAVAMAAGTGLLTPRAVLAAWPEGAFAAKAMPDALSALLGVTDAAKSGDIKVTAGDSGEARDGGQVKVHVETGMADVTRIAILAPGNPFPLLGAFDLGDGALGYAETRVKLAKSGDLIAVVKAGGKLYSASTSVRVVSSGCDS